MTTLTNKFQEITRRLQHLTVWRPNERDPFFELDQWRADAHTTIEQIFHRKRQQIEQTMEKHEREFMRQLTRQRSLLIHIRKRLLPAKEFTSLNRTQNDTSILSDLIKMENDINTRLGRAEIIMEITPLNLEDSIMIGLKTYLSTTSSIYVKEMLASNQPKKPVHRSNDEIAGAYKKWLQVKNNDETNKKELENARQKKDNVEEMHSARYRRNKEAYEQWLRSKKTASASSKKKLNVTICEIEQENKET